MNTIFGVTSQPKQNLTLSLDDGSLVSVYLEYRTQQRGWFVNFSWGDEWKVDGMRLTSSPNFLRHWIKLIPFGLAVLTAGDADPLSITSFSSGRTTLVLLNAADVLAVEETSFKGF